MKTLKFKKTNGWITQIDYRKTLNDLVITQWREEDKGTFRQIYLFHGEQDIVNQLRDFLNELDLPIRGEK